MPTTASTRIPLWGTSAVLAVAAMLGMAAPAYGQHSSADLAKKLSIPIASLISVPFPVEP